MGHLCRTDPLILATMCTTRRSLPPCSDSRQQSGSEETAQNRGCTGMVTLVDSSPCAGLPHPPTWGGGELAGGQRPPHLLTCRGLEATCTPATSKTRFSQRPEHSQPRDAGTTIFPYSQGAGDWQTGAGHPIPAVMCTTRSPLPTCLDSRQQVGSEEAAQNRGGTGTATLEAGGQQRGNHGRRTSPQQWPTRDGSCTTDQSPSSFPLSSPTSATETAVPLRQVCEQQQQWQ